MRSWGLVLVLVLGHPEVIDVDVSPAVIAEAGLDEGVGCVADVLLGHGTCEAVPRVPAHGGRERQAVAHDDAQVAARCTKAVGHGDFHAVLAPGVEAAGDNAGGRVEPESVWQSLRLVGNRPLSRGGDREQEWAAWPHADDFCSVDTRLR